MIAIRIRGSFLPAISRAKTSLGFGHGSVVEMRAVMYAMRKQLNTKVSLSRKIHIIALPQDTSLNARWSEPQSAVKRRHALGLAVVPMLAEVASVIGRLPHVSNWRQKTMNPPAQPASSASRISQTTIRKCQ